MCHKLVTPSPLLKTLITWLYLTDFLTPLFGYLVVIQRGENTGDWEGVATEIEGES